MFVAHTCILQCDTSFPADLAHVEVLVARPPPAPGRIARAIPGFFLLVRSSHAARIAVFLFRIQFDVFVFVALPRVQLRAGLALSK